jgi:hypothetical protein
MWLNYSQPDLVARVNPDFGVDEYPIPTQNAGMHRIIEGPDHKCLRFTELASDKIGTLDPDQLPAPATSGRGMPARRAGWLGRRGSGCQTSELCTGTMSERKRPQPLEEALQRTEADADASLKAAAGVTKALKRFRTLVHDGNLRELKAALAAVEQSVDALEEQIADTSERWDFDDAGYFANGAYARELLDTAASMRVPIFEQDERLYCYPSLVQVLPAERMVLIDRTRERRLRPSVVIEHLRKLHERPPRFRPEAFLETLYRAYRVLSPRHDSVERLARVYELLVLLPGQSREYSRQEFARDLYLLDRSGITRTTNGYVVSFPASTGTKSASGVITAISESGQERRYWGIAFSREG